MDVAATGPATGVVPWLVLGAILGLALAALGALAVGALLRTRRARPSSAPVQRRDDLPRFRQTPPGFPGARPLSRAGWVALAPPAPPAPAAQRSEDDRPARLLTALAAGVLLLIGAAALVAGLGRDRAAADRPPGAAERTAAVAEVRFAGLVLERRAVGVTVTTPTLRLAGDRAEVRLPTWNCLADDAPADPEAAGCARTRTEYAELAGPALEVDRVGDTLRVSGRFPTATRPNGGPPEQTGRAYELEFVLRTDGGDRTGELTGEVRLGDDAAPSRRG